MNYIIQEQFNSIFYRALLPGLFSAAICFASIHTVSAQTLMFSGYEWSIKSGDNLGPGPNRWASSHAWVDSKGYLHLKISPINGRWACAEVRSLQRFGFGDYVFQVDGPIDRLDRNVTLGLFNYPTPDVGPDTTNEIDIEFSHWGNPNWPIGNYTVWPAVHGLPNAHQTFTFHLRKPFSTVQKFTWNSQFVEFASYKDVNSIFSGSPSGSWRFAPKAYLSAIPQHPMPVLINLWLVKSKPPFNGRDVEIVIKSFTFTPFIP